MLQRQQAQVPQRVQVHLPQQAQVRLHQRVQVQVHQPQLLQARVIRGLNQSFLHSQSVLSNRNPLASLYLSALACLRRPQQAQVLQAV